MIKILLERVFSIYSDNLKSKTCPELSRRIQNRKQFLVACLLTLHSLPNDPIRSHQHVGRNRQADLLGGF